MYLAYHVYKKSSDSAQTLNKSKANLYKWERKASLLTSTSPLRQGIIKAKLYYPSAIGLALISNNVKLKMKEAINYLVLLMKIHHFYTIKY